MSLCVFVSYMSLENLALFSYYSISDMVFKMFGNFFFFFFF